MRSLFYIFIITYTRTGHRSTLPGAFACKHLMILCDRFWRRKGWQLWFWVMSYTFSANIKCQTSENPTDLGEITQALGFFPRLFKQTLWPRDIEPQISTWKRWIFCFPPGYYFKTVVRLSCLSCFSESTMVCLLGTGTFGRVRTEVTRGISLLNTGTQHCGKFGTVSISVPDTSESSKCLKYR